MGKLSDLLLGTPEQRAAKKKRERELKVAEAKAYHRGYRKARIATARKRGAEAGRGGGGIGGTVSKAQGFLSSQVLPRLENLADIGVGDIGIIEPRRLKPKKTRKTKKKGTTIKINGTTITIAKVAKKKKKKKTRKSEPSIFGW